MVHIGIRQDRDGYHLADPASSNTRSVWLSNETINTIMSNPTSIEVQDFLGASYGSSRARNRFWEVFRTENAMWHIHGVIATATLFLCLVYPIAMAFGVEVSGPYMAPAEVGLFAAVGIGSSIFSLYALLKRRRSLKKAGALYLYLSHLFFISYYITEGIPNIYQFITTVAFALILAVVYREWSK